MLIARLTLQRLQTECATWWQLPVSANNWTWRLILKLTVLIDRRCFQLDVLSVDSRLKKEGIKLIEKDNHAMS